MKVAIVRGPFLNPWELQTYEPLSDHHELTLIGANWQFYHAPFTNISIPVQKASVWCANLARLHPALFVGLNRLTSWILGRSYGFYDLESFVRNADILHSAETFSTMTYQCLQIRQHRGCKVVATVWENLPHMGETHPIRRKRKRQALQQLDGFLAVTETSRRVLLAEGAPADRIEVIPMAVDLSHFVPAARDTTLTTRWNLKNDEKVVLFVGRWVLEKGVDDLVQAIPKVLNDVPGHIRFCFVGAGPMDKILRKASRDHPGHVQLIPFAAYDQLPRLHNMADVFVLPSKSAPKWQEQFGYVLAESMACGKAVVTTRSGSIPDVVSQAALLVAPGNVSELASAIIRLLQSEQDRRRLGELARRYAIENFDAEKNSRRIEAFYQHILTRKT